MCIRDSVSTMTTELPLTLPADEPAAPGPLSSLTAAEIEDVSRILRDAGAVTDTTRFVYVGLLEPDKADVLAARAGDAPVPDREARVLLLDVATGASTDAAVSLTRGEVVALVPIDGSRGQVPILEEEFEAIGGILVADAGWLAALEKRGLTAEQVVCAPLSPGSYDIPGEEGRRIIRVFAFRMDHAEDHPWAHPVDGLCAYVDVIARTVTQVVDVADLPVPEEPGNFHLPAERPAPLDALKPISITQPEGPSFAVDGDTVTWANWSFSLGFDAREGLILRDLAFADPDQGGAVRPVIYRASIAEMVVPYADPSPTRYWQNYFDTGEYLFGRFANSLTLGCDCLGVIHYFDGVVADDHGNPVTIPQVVCMHEEDYGILWKHTDLDGKTEVRRSRPVSYTHLTLPTSCSAWR